jgi:hypothetical protein
MDTVATSFLTARQIVEPLVEDDLGLCHASGYNFQTLLSVLPEWFNCP